MTKSLSWFAVALSRVSKTFAVSLSLEGNFLALVFFGSSLLILTLFLQSFYIDFVSWCFTVSLRLAYDEMSPDGSLIVVGYFPVDFDDDTPVVDADIFRHEFFEGVN